MQSVRNKSEYPSPADVIGTTRFDGNLMRPVVIKNGQVAQVAGVGNFTSITTTYQALPSDGVILAGNTTSYTVTLPAIADVPKGFNLSIKKTGASGTLTIDGSGSETIDGSLTLTTATQNDTIALVSNGTAWFRINLATTSTLTQRLLTVTTQTTTATVATSDDVTIDTGTADHTLTLPTAVGNTGLVLRFKKTGATGVVTVDGATTETIDGALTITLTTPQEQAAIVSDGTNWIRVDVVPHISVVSKSTTYTALVADALVVATGNTAFTITLPAAATCNGKILRFKKTGTSAGVITIDGNASETIDGALTYLLNAQYQQVEIISDGSNWHTVTANPNAVVTSQSTTYTTTAADDVVICTGNSAFTVSLIAAATVGLTGKRVTFKKTGTAAGPITLDANASETIDGALTYVLYKQYEEVTLICDGTNWHVAETPPTRQPIASYTTTATMAVGDEFVLCTGTGSYVLTLPAVATAIGRTYVIKKTGASGTITVTPNSGTIDGAGTKAISTQYACATLISDGTNWHEISNAVPA